MAKICVQSQDFNMANESQLIRQGRQDIGAIVSFIGLVRDFNDKSLKSMTLEHYPAMTKLELERIADEAKKRWPLQDLTIIHRHGELFPGDQIVLVITASAHRSAAFQAASYVMDFLKTRAPFWKKEKTEDTNQWVEAKHSDETATKDWS
jgi:molybdopterin synthase catalytic subunit